MALQVQLACLRKVNLARDLSDINGVGTSHFELQRPWPRRCSLVFLSGHDTTEVLDLTSWEQLLAPNHLIASVTHWSELLAEQELQVEKLPVVKDPKSAMTDIVSKRAHYSPPWADVSIIGIAGSSGSGKSTLSHAIVSKLSLPWVVILSMV